MSREEQDIFDLVESREDSPVWLGLAMDNRRLFDALQDGWLRPLPSRTGSLVGVNAHLCERKETDENRIAVRFQVDVAKLPDLDVTAFRGNQWQSMPLSRVNATDAAVFWPGVVPLFSVRSLTVSTEEQRARLLSIGKRTSNIELPTVRVDRDAQEAPSPPTPPPEVDPELVLPTSADSVRGALSMALWAVPRIDPWMDVLIASLSSHSPKLAVLAGAVDANWLRLPPWARPGDARPDGGQERLWKAAAVVLGSTECPRPREATERIAAVALESASANDASVVEAWRMATHRILRAEAAIQHQDWRERPVGLAIQLVLSRPEPITFKTWFDDNHISLPPAVAWSAATLCGLFHGYKRLDKRFRGKRVQRELIAFQALRMCSAGTGVNWPDTTNDPPKWRKETGSFVLSWGGLEFACKHEQERGQWYAADLESHAVRQVALTIAKERGWPCLSRVMSLKEGSKPIYGSGTVEVHDRLVNVCGDVLVRLSSGDKVEEVLDGDAFRHSVAVEPGRLPAPPVPQSDVKADEGTQAIPGLRIVRDFLTATEEAEILTTIDQHDWSNELQRRVQHYGWRYDYKSRQVGPSMRIGSLPDWADRIATRLVDEGLFREDLPDQVIVNEYCGNQGVTPHIDSPSSFAGVVAMISLLETWEMEFRKQGSKDKVIHKLEQRSVTILESDARYRWTHEIPKRKTEPGPVKPGNRKPSRIPRRRRISLTFRKVIDTAKDPCTKELQQRD